METDDPEEFERKARQDSRVRYLEEDRRGYELAYEPDDPRFPDQYGPQAVEAPSAWDTSLGATAVKLGLLDTGIEPGHEDLPGDRIGGHDYVHGDGTPEDSGGDCAYHGSHTSGTAAALTDNGKGIAGMSESTIVMHKIFAAGLVTCESASTSDVARALEDLGDEGAHISSNSWGGATSSTTLNEAIDYAHDKGVIHVAAAGNTGPCSDCVSPPWRDRPGKVLIVSCTDDSDGWCTYSSQGPEVDLAAPGDDVLSVDGGTTAGYTRKSGTSMSAPHVAGAVALYVAAHADVNHSAMEEEIAEAADDVGLPPDRQGAGRLDAAGLVEGGPVTARFTASCDVALCTFDGGDTTHIDGSIASYEWELGDGTNATGENLTHEYAEGGNYTVNLTATGDDGAANTTSKVLDVADPNDPPTANLSASCQGLECTFRGGNSTDDDGTVVAYDWDLGDGTDATGENVTHTYETGENVTVTLNVTDDEGATDAANRTLDLNHLPDADFTHGCSDLECGFDASASDDSDGNVTGYAWSFGDGTNATGLEVNHTYEVDGTYNVTLVATDDEGAEDTRVRQVDVAPDNEGPDANATAACDELTCTLDGGNSTDPDGNVTAYDWDLGDGTDATGENVTHTYETGENVTVTLTVTDDLGATGSTAQEVDPNALPSPAADVACDDLDCAFEGGNSTDPDGAVVAHEWELGDGTNATGENLTHTYDEGGNYTVNLTVTDDEGATAAASREITVTPNDPPEAAFAWSPGEPAVGEDVAFEDGSGDADGSVVAWSWDLGDGNTSTDQDPVHAYGESGNYTVNLTVTDDDGATDTVSATVDVHSAPPEADFVTEPGSPTTQETVDFLDRSSDLDGSVVAWEWDLGDGNTSTDPEPSHRYPDDGTYTVTLTVTDDAGFSDTTTGDVTVENVPPDPDFSWSPPTPEAGEAVDFQEAATDVDGEVVRWTWTFGDGDGLRARNPSHTYDEAGYHDVTLSAVDDDGGLANVQRTVHVVDEPGPPRDVDARTRPLHRDVLVTWEPPEDTGAATVTGYRVYRSPPLEDGRTLLAAVDGDTHRHADPAPPGLHGYEVEAVNQAGVGPPASDQAVGTGAVT